MPRIKVSGVQIEDIKSASRCMIDEMQALIECPRDYFVIECINNTFIKDSVEVQGEPFIEVAWFDRGQEIQDKAAKIITQAINAVGYSNIDVVFIPLDKNAYYENGEHF